MSDRGGTCVSKPPLILKFKKINYETSIKISPVSSEPKRVSILEQKNYNPVVPYIKSIKK